MDIPRGILTRINRKHAMYPAATMGRCLLCRYPDLKKLIKIDTEGNELDVLRGAIEILEKHRVKCVVCELSEFGLEQMGHSEIEVRDFMLKLGYERLAFLNGRLTPLRHDHYIKSGSIIKQYFVPREFFGEEIPYLSDP